MNTWNTITTRRTDALHQSVFILETLTLPENIPIIAYLTKHAEAGLTDLVLHTGYDVATLETLLDLLLQTGVVQLRSTLYENKYCINHRRIAKINAIVQQLTRK